MTTSTITPAAIDGNAATDGEPTITDALTIRRDVVRSGGTVVNVTPIRTGPERRSIGRRLRDVIARRRVARMHELLAWHRTEFGATTRRPQRPRPIARTELDTFR
ncbi:MAG: hypothetical protein AAFP84_15600 [Actinomycetota bacterium]